MTLVEGVNFGVALVGAVLGIISTTYLVRQNQVRLRVTPAHALYGHGPDPAWGMTVEVVNLGSLAVTVTAIGLKLANGKQMIQPVPRTTDGGPFPRHLEPRASVSVLFDAESVNDPAFRAVTCAFARTACGVEKRGTSGALRQLREEGVGG